MKLLVGRQFDAVGVQREIAKLPFTCVKLPGGGIGISISYNNEPMTISAEHFMAMMLTQAKKISSDANDGLNIGDAVLAVPHWFTEAQRRGVLQACEIASLNCLKVTNESNAIALSYGIFKSAKKLFSESESTHVMFIDIGYSGYCVTIVDFMQVIHASPILYAERLLSCPRHIFLLISLWIHYTVFPEQENMKVLSTVCDHVVSGRAFDDIIVEYLAEQFQSKTGLDVRSNPKAMLKMQAAGEKAKKTLSPAGVKEVNINVECLAEDRDLSCTLTRDEFEKRSAGLVDRLREPIEQALREAGLQREDVKEVEVVGGCTRVNIIKRTLGEILGLDASAMNYGLKTTMNADEAVARGCALQCAMLSSRMKVKPFNVIDRMAHGIVAHYETTAAVASSDEAGADNGAAAEGQTRTTSSALYSRGDEIPRKPRRLTFRDKTSDFSITLTYDDAAAAMLPEGESKFLSKYTVKVPERAADAPPSDVRVTFHLDKNGCVFVQSAQLFEELPAAAPDAPDAAAEGEAKTEGEGKDGEGKDGEGKDGESKDGAAAAPKKRFRKTDLQVMVETPGLTSGEVKVALELEASMAYEDRLIVETADKRNELEAYIYSMRDKLDGALKPYATSAERDTFKSAISAAEEWLYGDEGFDSTKQAYTRKIDELRLLGDPIERRVSEAENRPAAIDGMKKQIEHCKTFCAKYGDEYEHITEEERDAVRKATGAAEDWMYDTISKQGDLPQHADPVLTCEAIKAKRQELHGKAQPVMSKPRPAPAPAPAPEPVNTATPPPAGEDTADSKGAPAEAAEGKTADDAGAAAADKDGGAEPMEQAKGGPEEK